jgi:hypothetical protein
MRRNVLAAILLAFLATILPAAEEPDLVFDWAFVKRARDGSPVSIDFSERVNLSSGDLFKIHVQPISKAYLYVFLHAADGSLELLFPDRFEAFESPTYQNTSFFIPSGDNWFALDESNGCARWSHSPSPCRKRWGTQSQVLRRSLPPDKRCSTRSRRSGRKTASS